MSEIIKDIHWKSLVFGAAFCAVIAMFGSRPGLEILAPFASIGLLYIGYKGKNIIWGTVLGAIGAIPLFAVAIYGGLGSLSNVAYDPVTLSVLILITCLLMGAILGFIGALFHKNYLKSKEAREKQQKIGKNKKKNKKEKK